MSKLCRSSPQAPPIPHHHTGSSLSTLTWISPSCYHIQQYHLSIITPLWGHKFLSSGEGLGEMHHPQSCVSNFIQFVSLSERVLYLKMKFSWVPQLRNPTGKSLTCPPTRGTPTLWCQQSDIFEARGSGKGDFTFWIWSRPLSPWVLSCLHSGLVLWKHRAFEEILTPLETVSQNELEEASVQVGALAPGSSNWAEALTLHPCLCFVTAMPVPGHVPQLTHGHNVPPGHWLSLISMHLSGHLGSIWSPARGLLCLLCSSTEGLLLLPEWHLSLWISLALLPPNTWRIFWRINPEMFQQHQGAQH